MTKLSQRHVLAPTLAALLGFALTSWGAFAGAQQTSNTGSNAKGPPEPPAAVNNVSALAEIVVTGSHIHGADAAGSKLTVIGREQIDASGYGRIEDVLG